MPVTREVRRIMAKICTDINQSKRLQELGLKLETADMCYRWHDNRYYCVPKDVPYPYSLKDPVPACVFLLVYSTVSGRLSDNPLSEISILSQEIVSCVRG